MKYKLISRNIFGTFRDALPLLSRESESYLNIFAVSHLQDHILI